jgi:purine nucleosidase
MQKFLIDTDTGSDDAVALVMALRHPDVDVVGITTVAGNVPLEMSTQNALYTVALCGQNTPVYAGIAKPMLRKLETAQNVHGLDGMGDVGLPLRGRQPAKGHAVPAILDIANQHANDITLVTLGPLTNIAAALLIDPELEHKISRCVVMGGTSDSVGNVSAVSEFNIWVDPEAARIVFESGLPITLVGWDISRKYAVIDSADAEAISAIGTPLAKFVLDINRVVREFSLHETGLSGFDLPDPIAMAIAIDPSVATQTLFRFATVEMGDGLCRGQTVIDYLSLSKRPPNVTCITAASREKFIQMLHTALR